MVKHQKESLGLFVPHLMQVNSPYIQNMKNYTKLFNNILIAFQDGNIEKARKLFDSVAEKAWMYEDLNK